MVEHELVIGGEAEVELHTIEVLHSMTNGFDGILGGLFPIHASTEDLWDFNHPRPLRRQD